MAKKSKHKVKKADKERVVISETLPDETPIIFSNDGFYLHCKSKKAVEYASIDYPLEALFDALISKAEYRTTPYTYKIRKNEIALRTLYLPHPGWQFRAIDFYSKFDSLICHYCSVSPASLRYPKRIASSFYYKNKNADMNKYRGQNISTLEGDLLSKHSSSYFAYGGFNREYKFFKSEEFIRLEKRFSAFWSLDVSKCFDSIYTHSISWAVKTKEVTKEHIKHYSFGEKFDSFMQSGKRGETNGIIIGPEISRIFSEIIFQAAEKSIILELSKKKDDLHFDKDYVIKRYVDDIFIFARNEDIARRVANIVSLKLFDYNLHLNDGKHKKYTRPFFTDQSRIIFESHLRVADFLDKFIKRSFKEETVVAINSTTGKEEEVIRSIEEITLKRIHDISGIKNSFLQSIKSIVSAPQEANSSVLGYSAVSGFIVSILSRELISLTESCAKQIKKKGVEKKDCFCAIECLIETMFFFYTVEHSVSASYKLARTLLITSNFVKEHLEEYSPAVHQRILELFIDLYESGHGSLRATKDETTPLEKINILLALGEMGEDYLIPPLELEEVFKGNDDTLGYFEIVSCLFYIKNNSVYSSFNKKIEAIIAKKLAKIEDVSHSSEELCLLLDTLTCPYLAADFRKKILKKASNSFSFSLSHIGNEDEQLQELEKHPWFVNWHSVNLISLLEKKELNLAY